MADEGGRDWSGLPDPALLSVLMHLVSLADFCSFRRVCAAWRRIARAEEASFMASLPPLLFHPSQRRRLYSVAEKRFYDREEVAGEEDHDDGDICGFSHGHLISRDRRLPNPRLAITDLISGADFGGAFPAWPRGAARGALLTAPPASPGCVLVANDRRRLLYCRPGDPAWTAHDWPNGWIITSMVASNTGKLYGLTQNGRLVVVELLAAGPRVTRPEVQYFPFDGFPCLASYGDDELLAFPHLSDTGTDDLTRFRLCRLDWGSGRWVEAEEMGGRGLFVSSSVWAVVEDPSDWGKEGDCVFFAGVGDDPRRPVSICVLHLKEKRVEQWSDPRFPRSTWLAAAWILTNSGLSQ